MLRPSVQGKFFFLGEEKFYARGVTYGTFRPSQQGQFPAPEIVERDFAMMAAHGVNTVRTYTVPPVWLLDAAVRHGLHVLVGLAWPEHKTFLDSKAQADEAAGLVRSGVRACAGHPAVFSFAVGNEIPASLVRWYGARRVEAFIERLYRAAKQEDPDALVTYINYPSTEYLDVPFLDWSGFNVYLESRSELRPYIGRLQNLAGERPLVMTELGLDSRRHGEEAQAAALKWQLETTFEGGCAGAFAYSWTDEWHRGGFDIEDWDFGVTTRDREPKPALLALRDVYERVPVAFGEQEAPRISVVVCSYNGARILDDCLSGMSGLNYPNYETIVVNDGSTDATPEIAARYDVRLISTKNRGLSAARNTGAEAATGEIVAYIDDDARPDPDWLGYLATAFRESEHVGVGGPNLAPSGDGLIAEGVANSPGGPMHVLLSDEIAEHIPGCNMAFRKKALLAIGGFDERFRTAGDDVDICWRLQAQGWTLGFHPAAVVWHHRRNSVRAYWRQQVGYGRAEALLEEKWPERYNRTGHLTWSGRIYGRGLTHLLGKVRRLYHGTWGTAAFQNAEEQDGAGLWSLPQMPEWYLLVLASLVLTLLGLAWQPLLLAGVPLLALSSLLLLTQAWISSRRPAFQGSRWRRTRLRALTFIFHLLQPLARLRGRQRFGLTPWRSRIKARPANPRPRSVDFWSGDWHPVEAELKRLERRLRRLGCVPLSNGPYDRWDLQVNAGALAGARLRLAVEEHGAGVQRWLCRIWPVLQPAGLVLPLVLGLLALGAVLDGSRTVAWALLGLLGLVGLKLLFGLASASGAVLASLKDDPAGDDGEVEDPSEIDFAEPQAGSREANASFRYIPRLLPYLKPYWRLVVMSVILTFAVTLFGLAMPWPLQILLDNVLSANPPSSMLGFLPDSILNDRQNLLWFAILSGFCLALMYELVVVLSNFMSTKIEQHMALDLRGDLFTHAQKMSMAFHDQRRSGSLIYAVNFQASSAVGILMAIPPMLQSLLTLVGMFVILATIDLYLGLLSLAVVPLLYLYISYYAGHVQTRLRTVKRLEARSLSIIHEAMSMFRVICAFGREGYEFNRFRAQGEEAVDARVNVTLRQTLFTLAVNATTAGGTALVLGFGAMRALSGDISPGQMIVAVSYLAAVYKPLERLSYTIGGLQERFVSTQLAFRLKDTEPDIEDRPGAIDLDRAEGHVVYENVSFSYKQRDRTLQDISFEAPAGSFVGVIGPTGAGKTTLVSLLPRFYEPSGGRILLDGHDIRDLTVASLRQQVSIVMQDPLLFTGTIADNIRYGRLDAEESEVIEAARAANAHDFITNLKKGYDTPVGERGVQISGGERQRICIARAFLKDAPILILDEPTSSVDTRTESEILDALGRLMTGRTTFMIAHRLWTLRHADLILVVDKGRIVEQGRHHELLQRGGLYSQLHEMQNGRPDPSTVIDGTTESDLTCPKCASPMFQWQQDPRVEIFLCHQCMARLELPARLGLPAGGGENGSQSDVETHPPGSVPE